MPNSNFSRIGGRPRPERSNSRSRYGRDRDGSYGNRADNNNSRTFQTPNYPNNNNRNPFDQGNYGSNGNGNRNGESSRSRFPRRDLKSFSENRNRNPEFSKPNKFVSASEAFKSSLNRKRAHDSDSDASSKDDNDSFGKQRRRDSAGSMGSREIVEKKYHSKLSTESRGPPANMNVSRVEIPQDEHQEINFAGLLIGPKGSNMKELESETGARIIIRGKQLYKKKHLGVFPCQDEPLHAHIFSPNPEAVQKACEKISGLIQQWIRFPATYIERMTDQLRWVPVITGEPPVKPAPAPAPAKAPKPAPAPVLNDNEEEKVQEGQLLYDFLMSKLNEAPSKAQAGPPKPKKEGGKTKQKKKANVDPPPSEKSDSSKQVSKPPRPSLSLGKNRGSTPPPKGGYLKSNRQQYSPPPREMFWKQGPPPSY